MHEIALPAGPAEQENQGGAFEALDMGRTALIIVDMQNFFLGPDGVNIETAREIIPGVNALAAATRRSGGTVVFLRHTYVASGRGAMPGLPLRGDSLRQMYLAGLREGTSGHALHPGIEVDDEDLVVLKYRPSAFLPNSSNLDAILRKRGIDTVIITGTATNVCCESTARDAQMMDYRVLFVADCTATSSDELHNAALLNLQFYFAEIVWKEDLLRRMGA